MTPNNIRPLTMKKVFFLTIVLLLAIATMPLLQIPFAPRGDIIDTSWAWAIGYGAAHGMQWGKNIIWTYGPFGYLDNAFFYSDHALWYASSLFALSLRLLSMFIIFFTALKLARDVRYFATYSFALILTWIIAISALDLSTLLALDASSMLLLTINGKKCSSYIYIIAFSIFISIASLIKFSQFVFGLTALITFILYAIMRYERSLAARISVVAIGSSVTAFILLWMLADQRLSSLPAFLVSSYNLMAGYSSAMSLNGLHWELVAAIIGLLSFLCVAIMSIRMDKKIFYSTFVLLPFVFINFKEGFTRSVAALTPIPGLPASGLQQNIYFGSILFIACLLIFLLRQTTKTAIKSAVLVMYLSALLPLLLTGVNSFNVAIDNYTTFSNLIRNSISRRNATTFINRSIRNEYQLSPQLINLLDIGSVNIVPWDLLIIQGYHLKYDPSPVIQQYSAYTPYLDHANADQILRGTSARHILYIYKTIDNRYPAFDAPYTFRALVRCYKYDGGNPNLALLLKSRCRAPIKYKRVKSLTKFNSIVQIPANTEYLKVRIKQTMIGKLFGLLYKLPALQVYLAEKNNMLNGPYRLVYKVANDGLFVRYYLQNQSAFNDFVDKNHKSLNQVTGIYFSGGPGLFFRNKIRLTFLIEKPKP